MKVTILKENYDPLYPLVIDITLAMKTCSLHRLLKKNDDLAINNDWLVVSTCFNPSEKYESQLGVLFPIYGNKPPSR